MRLHPSSVPNILSTTPRQSAPNIMRGFGAGFNLYQWNAAATRKTAGSHTLHPPTGEGCTVVPADDWVVVSTERAVAEGVSAEAPRRALAGEAAFDRKGRFSGLKSFCSSSLGWPRSTTVWRLHEPIIHHLTPIHANHDRNRRQGPRTIPALGYSSSSLLFMLRNQIGAPPMWIRPTNADGCVVSSDASVRTTDPGILRSNRQT